MTVSDILQFIYTEMQKAIEAKNKERVLDLGTTVDVLYETSIKHNDRKLKGILDKFDYVVFHFEDEFSFAENYMKEIQEMIFEY